jgi:S-adenosylmethionine hydrolase
MKGVILSISTRASIVDITHEIGSGDVQAGAFALAASYSFFPKGTVHVAVVDPGVGSRRQAIAAKTAHGFFVGPDNGILWLALARQEIEGVHAIQNLKYCRQPVSQTFHGRDIFAPVAAHLSRGLAIQKLGPVAKDFVRLNWPKPTRKGGKLEGEVIYVDRFGNGITNIPGEEAIRADASCEILTKPRRQCAIRTFYQAVPVGQLVAVPGSTGFLEVAINGGSAREKAGLKVGTRVAVR